MKLETPHFPSSVFESYFRDSVYEPAEDTFLLLDALESELFSEASQQNKTYVSLNLHVFIIVLKKTQKVLIKIENWNRNPMMTQVQWLKVERLWTWVVWFSFPIFRCFFFVLMIFFVSSSVKISIYNYFYLFWFFLIIKILFFCQEYLFVWRLAAVQER